MDTFDKSVKQDRTLENVVQQFTVALQVFLRDYDKNASCNLYNSLKTRVEIQGTVFEIILHSEDYLKYVDEGRGPGKFPPLDKIKQWIRIKPVLPTPMNGKLPTENQLAYLIGRKIANKGIEPTNIINKTVDSYQLEKKARIAIYSVIDKLTEDLINKNLYETL